MFRFCLCVCRKQILKEFGRGWKSLPLEDFTTYTEVDPNSHLSQTTSRSTFSTLQREETAYLYDDKGSGHFDGDFEHLFDFYVSVAESNFAGIVWAVAQDLGNYGAQSNELLLILRGYGTYATVWIREVVGGSAYSSTTYTIALSTYYYGTVSRSGDQFQLKLYSDADRTDLLATLNLTLHSVLSYQYIYAPQSYGSGGTYEASGYVENLDLQEGGVTAKTWTSDVHLVKRLTKTYTADTQTVNRFTKTLTSDAALINRLIKTLTADSVLKACGLTKTWTADIQLVKRLTKTFSTDSHLIKRFGKTWTADTVLISAFTAVYFTADTVLVNRLFKTYTADTHIINRLAKTLTADTALLYRKTITFTADAIVGAPTPPTPSLGGAYKLLLRKPFKQKINPELANLLAEWLELKIAESN